MLKLLCKLFWQNHIAYTDRRRHSAGKGVYVYYLVVFCKRKYGVFVFAGDGQFRVIVVFHNIPVALFCPVYVFVPFGSPCGDTAWKTVERGYVQHSGFGAVQFVGSYPVTPHGKQVAFHAVCAVNLHNLFVGRVFQSEDAVFAKKLNDKAVQILGAGADDYLAGFYIYAAAASEIGSNCLAKLSAAEVWRLYEQLVSIT